MHLHLKLIRRITIATIALVFCTSAVAADLGVKDQPIRLAMLEWTGQHVTTHVTGEI
ncbi:MAG: hypothetical protein HY308_16830 [Gammaproteobacteria bacterium]|nr:hypothetical protein [Gammaproteobacteria bacterium]